jgi:hypothetical protein
MPDIAPDAKASLNSVIASTGPPPAFKLVFLTNSDLDFS